MIVPDHQSSIRYPAGTLDMSDKLKSNFARLTTPFKRILAAAALASQLTHSRHDTLPSIRRGSLTFILDREARQARQKSSALDMVCHVDLLRIGREARAQLSLLRR